MGKYQRMKKLLGANVVIEKAQDGKNYILTVGISDIAFQFNLTPQQYEFLKIQIDVLDECDSKLKKSGTADG